MEKSQICLSFVGVVYPALSFIPSLDNEFCRELFGRPLDTVSGLTPTGFTIALQSKPFPMVVITPERIIVKSENKSDLLKYTTAIKNALKEKMASPIHIVSYGINFEYQWVGLLTPAEKWMWDHFIKDSFNTEEGNMLCPKINLRVVVDDSQSLNIELEPRVGIRDGIYANINHHHNVAIDEIPEEAELKSIIDASESMINEKAIYPFIENK